MNTDLQMLKTSLAKATSLTDAYERGLTHLITLEQYKDAVETRDMLRAVIETLEPPTTPHRYTPPS